MEVKQTVTSQVPEFIKKAIDREVELATKEELEKAKKRIEERSSQIITGVILHVQQMVQFQTREDNLIITIKLNK